MLAHVAGIPVEEALLAAPALLAGATVIVGYVRATVARNFTDSKERKVMDPQEITEAPQDRTGSWTRRRDEYAPQEPAGGRS